MKSTLIKYFTTILLFIVVLLTLGAVDGHNPFNLVPPNVEYLKHKKVLTFEYDDKEHSINILNSESGIPLMYYANIITPICEDRVCEVVNLRLFWDLSGNYIAFDTIPGFPLTKMDHKPFSRKDYLKLHSLLKDKSSILKDKNYSDLVITDVNNPSSLGIDAVSSATALEVKEIVVDGAVYSSYSLWHIANGVSAYKIREFTFSNKDKRLIEFLLNSDNPNSQLLGLQMLEPSELHKYNEKVLFFIKESNSIVQKYLLETISDDFINKGSNQEEICKNFKLFSAENRELLLSRLISIDNISGRALLLISENLASMSYIQVKDFVSLLNKNKNNISIQIKQNINYAASSSNFKYNYLLKKLTDF